MIQSLNPSSLLFGMAWLMHLPVLRRAPRSRTLWRATPDWQKNQPPSFALCFNGEFELCTLLCPAQIRLAYLIDLEPTASELLARGALRSDIERRTSRVRSTLVCSRNPVGVLSQST